MRNLCVEERTPEPQRPACLHNTPWGVRCMRCLPTWVAGEPGRAMLPWERDMLSLIERRDSNGRRAVLAAARRAC